MAFYGRRRIKLGEALVNAKVITQSQLEKALENQKESHRKLGEILIDDGIVTEENIARVLSEQLGYEYVELASIEIPKEVLSVIPDSKLLRKNVCIPIGFKDGNINNLVVAVGDPLDEQAADDIAIVTGCQVDVVVATPRAVMVSIDKHYQEKVAGLEEFTRDQEEEDQQQEDQSIADSPIVKLLREMIEKAARKRASDIHIEPMERTVRIRYRIDGALYEQVTYDISIMSALSARVKIIGGMDISEKRKPQDGRITQVVDRVEYDIRVSVLPTVYGEKIVMRLAAKMALNREKSQLGLKPNEMAQFDHILKNPHGILLVTGPTGSGKSTTLYTALSELNTEDVNIITVEDPVEANIDGINQVQVNNKAELTFANALRSILRQDPDIIMIGEIRDQETAGIAVQASITGHLVVSTLHTNSSASTITRLADMGIEPYLIADSVIGVIAQRLVRRLCPECKRLREATPEEKIILGGKEDEPMQIYEPKGCAKCDNMGYKGRIGVYEIMEMTEQLKVLISKGGTANEIKEQAMKDGMHTLRMSASEYVLSGITSYSEMMKVSFDS